MLVLWPRLPNTKFYNLFLTVCCLHSLKQVLHFSVCKQKSYYTNQEDWKNYGQQRRLLWKRHSKMILSKWKLLFLIISNYERMKFKIVNYENYYPQVCIISMSETNQKHEEAISLHEFKLKIWLRLIDYRNLTFRSELQEVIWNKLLWFLDKAEEDFYYFLLKVIICP